MPIMNWNQGLDVGVPTMNNEHKILLQLMNELYDQNQAGAPHAVLVATFRELGRQTVRHFEDEERFMADIGFEGLERHKIIHKQLVQSFVEHRDAFERTGMGRVPDGVFHFLKIWLTSHIMGIDVKYGRAAQERYAKV